MTSGLDNVRPQPKPIRVGNNINEFYSQLKPDLLWTEARDLWSIDLEPVFGDFYGTRALGKDYPVPFLDAFPMTLWVSVRYVTISSWNEESIQFNFSGVF